MTVSLWGVHIGFAAIVTTLVLTGSDLPRGKRWTIIALSGIWAIVPDLYHFVPGTRSWYKPLLHDSPLADLFWLHRVIDRADPRDRPVYSLATLFVFIVVFVSAERWIRDVRSASD